MDQSQKRFRAFETSLEAAAFVPGSNHEFNEYIVSKTVVPIAKIGRNVAVDPFRVVTTLIHSYTGTPGQSIITVVGQ